MSEDEFEDALMSLQAYVARMKRRIAKTRFMLLLRTMDGCERIIEWTGSPPRDLHLTLARRFGYADYYRHAAEPEYVPMEKLSRRYEYVGHRDGLYVYEETP